MMQHLKMLQKKRVIKFYGMSEESSDEK